MVDLLPISTPREECLILRTRPISEAVLDKAWAGGFDQLPVVDDSGEFVGIVATADGRSLHEEGRALLPTDPALSTCEVDVSVPLDDLLQCIADHRALVFRDRRPESNRGPDWFGLVTLSDLNRHHFRSYLYPILAELEANCAELIERRYDDPWEWLPHIGEDMQIKLIGRWEYDKRKSIDTSPIIGCTLSELIRIVGRVEILRSELGYKSPGGFKSATGRFFDLRNRIMHPVRPLVTTQDDVLILLSTLQNIVELSARVRSAAHGVASLPVDWRRLSIRNEAETI